MGFLLSDREGSGKEKEKMTDIKIMAAGKEQADIVAPGTDHMYL